MVRGTAETDDQGSDADDETEVRALYHRVLDGWNRGSGEPKLNAMQSLVAEPRAGDWRIVLYQNTPAQLHGRPELVESLTEALRQELKKSA
jgi:hypothetical protein